MLVIISHQERDVLTAANISVTNVTNQKRKILLSEEVKINAYAVAGVPIVVRRISWKILPSYHTLMMLDVAVPFVPIVLTVTLALNAVRVKSVRAPVLCASALSRRDPETFRQYKNG